MLASTLAVEPDELGSISSASVSATPLRLQWARTIFQPPACAALKVDAEHTKPPAGGALAGGVAGGAVSGGVVTIGFEATAVAGGSSDAGTVTLGWPVGTAELADELPGAAGDPLGLTATSDDSGVAVAAGTTGANPPKATKAMAIAPTKMTVPRTA